MTCKYCGKPSRGVCDTCSEIQIAIERDPEVIGKIAEDTLTEDQIEDLICSLRDARYAVQMRVRNVVK